MADPQKVAMAMSLYSMFSPERQMEQQLLQQRLQNEQGRGGIDTLNALASLMGNMQQHDPEMAAARRGMITAQGNQYQADADLKALTTLMQLSAMQRMQGGGPAGYDTEALDAMRSALSERLGSFAPETQNTISPYL